MICRNCIHSITGKTDGDIKMSKMGYKSCDAARTPEERGRYIKGDTPCAYPARFIKK